MERLSYCLALTLILLSSIGRADDARVARLFAGYSDSLATSQLLPAPVSTSTPVAPSPSLVAQPPVLQQADPQLASYVGMPQAAGTLLPPRHRFRVGAGFQFSWLRPRFSENVAAVVTQPIGNYAIPFEYENELTPQVWVGIENCRCLGLRARYWELETRAPTLVNFALAGYNPIFVTMVGANGNFSRTGTAVLGDAMTSRHCIKMRTIDLEGTQRLSLGCTHLLGSFGLRYAEIFQRSHAVATDGTGTLTELVCQDVSFEGFGPTTALEITRQLFVCRPLLSRLSWFTNLRGSILFGNQLQELTLVTGGGATLAEDEYKHDSVLPIAELTGGLQLLTQPLGRGLFLIRTGYRAETWFGTGGPVDTESNLGLGGVILSLAMQW